MAESLEKDAQDHDKSTASDDLMEKLADEGSDTPAVANGNESQKPLSASWRDEPLSSNESNKVMLIIEACNAKDRDQLVALASTEGGFIEDEMRRRACMES